MPIVKERLQCEKCGKKFEFVSRNRVEYCIVVGSPHFGNVISWDSKHSPHDVKCPGCGSCAILFRDD